MIYDGKTLLKWMILGVPLLLETPNLFTENADKENMLDAD